MTFASAKASAGIAQATEEPVCLSLCKIPCFWRIVFSEYFLNACITRASALAYALLLTLIPLLAVVAFMAASIMDIHPKQV